jgi:phytoene desaturase
MSKAVVIGAGVGGMAIGLRLRNLGYEVEILERSQSYGGKLRRFEQDGFVFDLGPSLFTLPAVYRDLFLKTGKPLEEEIELIALDTAFHYRFNDGTTLKLPGNSLKKISAAIAEQISPRAGQEWLSFISRASDMWQITRSRVLERPLTSLKDFGKVSLKDIQTIAPWKSLRELANEYFSDRRLVNLVDRYATYTGSDSRKLPAAFATIPYVEQEFGVYHIRGGITSLADALYRRCLERGVTFHFNTNVSQIEVAEGIARRVVTETSQHEADIVVVNADARILYEKLLPDVSAAQKKITRQTPSLSGFILLLAVDGETEGLEHHNVWLTDDYDKEFDEIFHTPKPLSDPTIYACVPRDDSMSPAGCESWFILINAPVHDPDVGVDWDEPGLKEQYALHILALLARRGTDIRTRIRWQKLITPADMQREVNAPGGAIYSTASHGVMTTFNRTKNTTMYPNVFLVGGSTHPGGGLPLVAMSAEIVANLIKQQRHTN